MFKGVRKIIWKRDPDIRPEPHVANLEKKEDAKCLQRVKPENVQQEGHCWENQFSFHEVASNITERSGPKTKVSWMLRRRWNSCNFKARCFNTQRHTHTLTHTHILASDAPARSLPTKCHFPLYLSSAFSHHRTRKTWLCPKRWLRLILRS